MGCDKSKYSRGCSDGLIYTGFTFETLRAPTTSCPRLLIVMFQVEGCRGDFCDFDVGKRVRDEETRRKFVEKAARAAGAANGLVGNLSPLRLKIISMDNEDLGDSSPASATSAVVRPGGRGPRIARHSDLNSERFDIPYKSVVQARQERPLAEAFLRRYARGEKGEYHQYLDGGEGDEPYLVGGKYPGVYYRPVKVCSNCHMVYTLVDEARARALRKVRRGGGGGGRQHFSQRVGVNQSERCDEKDAERVSKANKQLLSRTDKGDGEGGDPSTDNRGTGGDQRLAFSASNDGYEHSAQTLSLAEARKAMDVISQGDISELRSFVRPPAAVAHAASVAMILLEGKTNGKVSDAASVSWVVARVAMGRGDFLSRLRSFDPRTATHQQISAVISALERSSLDPAIVRPLSNAAGNLCLWILGAIQANRWLTGSGHTRTNTVPAAYDIRRWGYTHLREKSGAPDCVSAGVPQEHPFPHKISQAGGLSTPGRTRWASPSFAPAKRKRGRVENLESRAAAHRGIRRGGPVSLEPNAAAGFGVLGPATASPTLSGGASDFGFGVSHDRGGAAEACGAPAASPCQRKRDVGGRVAAQAFASGRLANARPSALPEVSSEKSFVCSDGRTRLPYRVCGDPGTSSRAAVACNFVVVHDFFDNVDKTEVLFRPVTRKHRGCRVLAFSYPGQAGTVFRVPQSMAASAPSRCDTAESDVATTRGTVCLPGGGAGGDDGGGDEPLGSDVPNNAFVAPRLHELLQHVQSVGEMNLRTPFHLVSSTANIVAAILLFCEVSFHCIHETLLARW